MLSAAGLVRALWIFVISFAYDTLNRRCTKAYAAAAVSCGGTSGNYLASYSYDLGIPPPRTACCWVVI